MVDYRKKIKVGKTSLEVTQLGLGSGSFGFLYEPVRLEDAVRTIERAHELGIQFFDTAPLYGEGLAEARLGEILPQFPRQEFTVASKVGYVVPEIPSEQPSGQTDRDYSYDGVLRSFENSLKRTGLDKIDILHIHDPDEDYQEAMTGAYRALSELRSEGVIQAVGAGMNQSAMLTRFAQEGDFDCFLLAGRYTLLDQSGFEDLLPIAEQKGISIFIGGPLNSGILANPYVDDPKFNYESASQKWVEKAQKIDAVCKRFDVPLTAAALQFPLAHPAVASIITGSRSIEELTENIHMLQFPIPKDLWQELKHEGLLPEEAPTP